MIEQISGDKLNLMPGEYGLWFRGSDGLDFSLIFGAQEIKYFEINLKRGHFCGGLSKPLRFGRIKRDHGERGIGFKRSDLIEYESELPQAELEEAIRFVSECEFELKLKSLLLEYLTSKGRNQNQLQSDLPFETFLKAKQEHKVKGVAFKYKKPLISIALTFIFLALVFWTHSLLNISYYERTCSEGSAWSCRKLIIIEMIRGNRAQVQKLERLEASAVVSGSRAQLQTKCDGNDFNSCLELYQLGEYAPGEERLIEWACKGANDEYCFNKALERLQREGANEESVKRFKNTLKGHAKYEQVMKAMESGADMMAGKNICRNTSECSEYGKILEAFGMQKMASDHFKRACDLEDEASCLKLAELAIKMGNKELSETTYRAACKRTRNPEACYKAAFVLYDDPADRAALREAYELCLQGSENYCLFLYDRLK